jgi:ribose 5-phosphate isomerase B
MADHNVPRRRFLSGIAAAQIAASQNSATGAEAAKMKVAVGADHAGFPLKGPVVQLLRTWGHSVNDLGTFSTDPVDFPDIAKKVCAEILAGSAQRGIMICGSGVGASIAANKVPNIRAALCHDTYCAHQGVEHDNVNVICMGALVLGPKLAEEILAAFLNAKFNSTDADFLRRVRRLEEMGKP